MEEESTDKAPEAKNLVYQMGVSAPGILKSHDRIIAMRAKHVADDGHRYVIVHPDNQHVFEQARLNAEPVTDEELVDVVLSEGLDV